MIDALDELITAADVDAVIVCGYDPAVLEGARQLAATGRPLIVFPSIRQGTTWFYEMGLVRDDSHVPLIPVFVARFAPPHLEFKNLLQGAINKALQIEIHRFASVATESNRSTLLSTDETEDIFFHDVDLMRWLGGEYSRVTSFQTGLVGDRFSQSITTLSGDGLPESLWSIQAARDTVRWILTAKNQSDLPMTLSGTDDETKWSEGQGCIGGINEDDGSSPYRQLYHCVQALEGKEISPNWNDVIRAAEICDGARRSIRRRRTIDLLFESTSERSQFKTHMTAIGCSLLTLTLFGVIFVLIAGTLLDPREAAEIKADHAEAIFYVDDFVPQEVELVAPNDERLEAIAVRMRGASFPVLIEGDFSTFSMINDLRREALIAQLKAVGAPDADQRVEIAELKGKGFQTLMIIARLLVFVPLGLFLLLQVLLFVTRPASLASKRKDGEPSAETTAP